MCRVRGNKRQSQAGRGRPCRCHLNTLASVWYGISITAFQAYIATRNTASLLQWNSTGWEELKGAWACLGAAIIALPVFLGVSLFKVGNLANDGYKLGRSLSTCQADPKDPLAPAQGLALLFRHGGPTAPFLHIFVAFCLLIPKLLLQPKLMEAGYIPKDNIWKTDLEFVLSSYDRLVVKLSFMTPPPTDNTTMKTTASINGNSISPSSPTAQTLTMLSNPSLPMIEEEKWGPVSIEFFNYALALCVYAVRYPAVFWNTNKYWGALFSFQLFVNGIQVLLIYTGVCILYKVHVLEPNELFNTLHDEWPHTKYSKSFFLLNPHVTLALFVLTTALVLSSSLVLYLYGYGRFNAFLNHEKACKVISVEGKEWGYLTHCTALCVLLAITVVEGPLLIDLAVIYKSTSDPSVLLCVIGIVFHLFIWVVLWLGLTLKQNWEFKLRVTVGKVAVRSARSIKLLTDVELVSSCEVSAPLLVVASGRTYTVCDTSPKKTIIGAIHKAAMERKAKLQATAGNREQIEENEEQIYWLRPKPISPKNSPDSAASDRLTWCRRQNKPKVTFNKSVRKVTQEDGLRGEDDGDYARLRESPCVAEACALPPESQLQHIVKNPRNSSLSQRDYEEPSPLFTPEPLELPPPPPCELDKPVPATPRCLRRADSGMPNDLTPRSDSEASASPPDHSETSSGVHSNSSRESNNPGVVRSLECNEETLMANQKCAQWNGAPPPPPESDSDSREVYIKRRVECESIPLASSPQDHFGRSTNMRMISFTDCQPSATLPHFPTQHVGLAYPQCSTMPLPPVMNNPIHPPPLMNYPRQHTTIPTHHNGVRLFNSNIYAKRFNVQRYPQQHHSFPLLLNQNNKLNFHTNGEMDPGNYNQNKLNHRLNGDIDTSNYSVVTNDGNEFQS